MATAALSPSVGRIEDPVTIKEAVALFAQTGYPVPESTLRRWAKEAGLRTSRSGGSVHYSDSELLVLHADRTFGS
ncbi:MerR family transcriptional regulator [Streptomyces sp. NPDC059524]|uniref:MerR family transcriptional regulator n=1 Tax=Streptomyces sp. NPDC059524 TaxID=3346856 RepID=UPI0036761268